jgi:hypothetical protein
MKRIKSFSIFENTSGPFTYSQLSDEARQNAIENIREEMWEGKHGADHIPEWVIDDDYLFEPTHQEMEEVFGYDYATYLKGNPMIANDRENISYVSKDDRNYYLHCAKALNVTKEGMFFGWLGIPTYFWDHIGYWFVDRGTYTTIDFDIEDDEDLDEETRKRLEVYLAKAQEKFKSHMDKTLDRITRDIDIQYEDGEIIDRIESNEILFDKEGNPID